MQSSCNAYRRMIYEDERRPRSEQLGFVLHLGDFRYEVCWYPDDFPDGKRFGRRIRELFRYPHGENLHNYHVPTTLDDYRTAYRAYLMDPDLQDARARFPFVPVWDNHEFSWQGFSEHPGVRRQTAPSTNPEDRGQPGVVGISAGARDAHGCPRRRAIQSTAGQRHAHREVRRRRLRHRRQQPHGGGIVAHLPLVPLRQETRT